MVELSINDYRSQSPRHEHVCLTVSALVGLIQGIGKGQVRSFNTSLKILGFSRIKS